MQQYAQWSVLLSYQVEVSCSKEKTTLKYPSSFYFMVSVIELDRILNAAIGHFPFSL